MKPRDVAIEVRDYSLTRRGIIMATDAQVEASIKLNDIGTWSITISGSHPLADLITAPGAGVVVTDTASGSVLWSGPMTAYKQTTDTSNGDVSTIVVSGVTDEVYLQDALVWADPTKTDVAGTTVPKYHIEGTANEVMHQLVNLNIGPGAIPARRLNTLTLSGGGAYGTPLKKDYRFPTILSCLQEAAVASTADANGVSPQPLGIAFSLRQQDGGLVFKTRPNVDRTKATRLSVRNQRLKSASISVEPPTSTQVIVSTGGDDTAGFVGVNTASSVGAEGLWHRRIEKFTSADTSNNQSKPEQTGIDILAKDGDTNIAAQAESTDNQMTSFGFDWNLGDYVTIESGGQEYVTQVTGFSLKINQSDMQFGLSLGDTDGFDLQTAMIGAMNESNERLAALERRA